MSRFKLPSCMYASSWMGPQLVVHLLAMMLGSCETLIVRGLCANSSAEHQDSINHSHPSNSYKLLHMVVIDVIRSTKSLAACKPVERRQRRLPCMLRLSIRRFNRKSLLSCQPVTLAPHRRVYSLAKVSRQNSDIHIDAVRRSRIRPYDSFAVLAKNLCNGD